MDRKRTAQPKYLVLKRQLLEAVKSESWGDGHQLPSENDLMKQHGVSRNTVRSALAELENEGFISRAAGRGTFYSGKRPEHSGRSMLLGVVVPSWHIFPKLISGVDDAAQEHGYHIVLDNIRTTAGPEDAYMLDLAKKKIDGLLYHPIGAPRVDEIKAWITSVGVPVVLLGWDIGIPDVSSVVSDDFRGGFLATESLIDAGHRRIAFIGIKDHFPSSGRERGYHHAHEVRSIPVDESLVRRLPVGDFVSGAAAATRELLQLGKDRPTAFFYFDDEAAFAGYEAIKTAGHSIPGDVSVMGYDDSDVARSLVPALSSVVHPNFAIGRWGAEILIDEIQGSNTSEKKHLVIQPTLVLRDSVCPPKVPQ